MTASTVAWRYRERLHVTIVVKAMFTLRPDAEMTLAAPEPLSRAEIHHRNSPTQSVRVTSDLAPYLARADVVLTGHACAPRGAPSPMVAVRLAVLRDRPLLDKTLHVYGDRRGGAPQPFERIPLVYERAVGGIGWEENPLGVGMKAGQEPDPTAANIVSPDYPMRSAGFGPISRAWPSRKRLLGRFDRKALELPIAEIPGSFDWSYFQAAPPDQQIEYLRGDEWIVLEGVDPDHARIASRLPMVNVRARAMGLGPSVSAEALLLNADKLYIDADTRECSVVWRGVVSPVDEQGLEDGLIVVGLELEGQPVEWPKAPPAAPTLPQGISDPEALASHQAQTKGAPVASLSSLSSLSSAPPLAPLPAPPPLAKLAAPPQRGQPAAPNTEQEMALPPAAQSLIDTYNVAPEGKRGVAVTELSPGASSGQSAGAMNALRREEEAAWSPGTTQLRADEIEIIDEASDEGVVELDETQWDVTTAPLGYKRTPTAAAQAVIAPFDETQWETTTAPLGFRRPEMRRAPASSSRPFDESQWNTSTAPLGYRKSRLPGVPGSPEEPDELDVSERPVLPFVTPPPPSPTSSDNSAWGTPTAPLLPADLAALRARPDTPFATIPDAGPPRAMTPSAPIPGAPWSSDSATIPQRSREEEPPVSSFDFDDTYPPRRARPGARAVPEAAALYRSLTAFAEAKKGAEPAEAQAPAGASRAEGAIPIVSPTLLTAFTLLPWQARPGRYARAIVIKATCDIVPGRAAKLRRYADPPVADVHAEGDPMKTLLYPTDLVGFKPKTDVTLKGHAHAPGGSAATHLVRFRVGRPGRGFDRSILVLGDRRWSEGEPGAEPSAPQPFTVMPLVFERAFGGPGYAANPAGRGFRSADLPNLEDPAHVIGSPLDAPPPAGFCGVPPRWEARSAKLDTTYAGSPERAAWPAIVPDDFDWSFFQAAPPAQQLDYLAGDEPFALVGVHPDHPKVEGSLPGLRPRCFVQAAADAGGAFEEIELRLDTATFDADEMKLHLVWRGLFKVRDEEASDVAEIFVMLERGTDPRAELVEAQAKYLVSRSSPPPPPEE